MQPACLSQTPDGVLIGTNGIDSPFRWDGRTTLVETAGIPKPTSAPTVNSTGSGNTTAGEYICGYRYVDDDGEFIEDDTPGRQPGSLSEVATDTATDSQLYEWTGLLYSSDTRVSALQLFRSTAGQSTTVYLAKTLPNTGAVTSSANNGGKIRLTLPSGHGLVVGARIVVAGHSEASVNTTHQITAVGATTADSSVNYSAIGTGGTWVIEGYMLDNASDATLEANQSLAIVNPDGTPNSRRFTQPPDFKAINLSFQSRHWYLVNVDYSEGTVSVSNGGTTITGSSTNWTSAMVGRYVTIAGDTRSYKIIIANTSALEISEAYAGTGGSSLSYVVRVAATENGTLYYSETDEPESVPATNTIRIQNNTGNYDRETGAFLLNSTLYVGQTRHLYAIRFNRQPNIDATITRAASRGMFNHRCSDVFEGLAYLMDQSGPYRFGGGEAMDVASPILDYFRDGTVDFSKSKWFFVKVDPAQEVVRFFVSFTADSSTRPKRSLCMNLRTGAWWTEKYPVELGGATEYEISGRRRVIAGSEDDTLLLTAQGTTDIVTSGTRGTVTSATNTTLVDSTASFTSAMIGAPVVIVSGTGKRQTRIILSRTSTELTVATWDTTPVAGDVYIVGGIEWSAKTGLFEFRVDSEANSRDVRLVYNPTTSAASFDVRRYIDHRTTPENFGYSAGADTGDTVETTGGSPDAVVNMLATKNSIGTASGFARLPIEHGMDDGALTDRWTAYELRGYQGNDAIRLFSISLDGVR